LKFITSAEFFFTITSFFVLNASSIELPREAKNAITPAMNNTITPPIINNGIHHRERFGGEFRDGGYGGGTGVRD